MSIGRFMAGVGALLWRPSDGKYLILKRSPDKDLGSGAWECTTGRVDQGESFIEAVQRELDEELGVSACIDFIVGVLHFYRGDARPENELLGVQFCCSLADDSPEVRLSWEHSEYCWVTAAQAAEMFPAGHWLGQTIRRAEAIRALSPSELLEYYSTNGFEL